MLSFLLRARDIALDRPGQKEEERERGSLVRLFLPDSRETGIMGVDV